MYRESDIMPYANKKLLELIRIKTDGNVSKFAEIVGLSQQRINRNLVMNKKTQKYPRLSDEVKQRCIEVFELDDDYFTALPVREEFNPLERLKNDFDNLPEKSELPHLPSKAAAGGMGGFSDCVASYNCEYRPVVKMLPKYEMTIEITGDSMCPKLENGDIIAIRKVIDIIKWGNVYVLDTIDGAVVKRLYDEGDKYRCRSFNPEYKDFLVDKRNVYGIYKVVGQIRIQL